MPQTNTYNPEIWLESLTRALKEYVEDGFNNFVTNAANEPIGLGLYEIIMEWPGANIDARKVPLPKNLIHFEVDDIDDRPLGFGAGVFAVNYNEVDEEIREQEAYIHEVNFEVGIWTWDKTGGTTARMRAQQILNWLFQGGMAQDRIAEATNSGNGKLEIIRYSGGRFATERIGDIDTYRMVDGELVIRVFSRTPMEHTQPAPTIEEISQIPGLTILG